MPSDSRGIPQHFIVFVPGIMGSTLRSASSGEIIWIDFSSLPLAPWNWDDWVHNLLDTLRYPNDDLVPSGIVNDVLFLPPWIKQEQYGRLFEAFESMGYRADPANYPEEERDVYAFPYDWRQDNRISARQLGQAIERWRGFHPDAQVWIVAHSMGGLVSRWYIEKEGGKEHVARLFLLASPWDGAPKALSMLTTGFEVLFRQRLSFLGDIQGMTRDLIRSFPSPYQLLPYQNPFLRGADNEPVDLYSSATWLDTDEQRQMLLDGRAFNTELGRDTSVETLCFFGVKRPTVTDGLIDVIANGHWGGITWRRSEAGDGTVPERSAVHTGASEKLPFAVGHGDIYVDPALLEKLEWELIRRYQAGVLAEVTTDRLHVMFEPTSYMDRDGFDPGDHIHVWATVAERESGQPVLDATITARFAWHSPLPGDDPATYQYALTDELASVELVSSTEALGRYEGVIDAPRVEGYYRLEATVDVPGNPAVNLHELVLIEGMGAAPPDEAEMMPPESAGGDPPTTRTVRRNVEDMLQATPEANVPVEEEIVFGGGLAAGPGPGTLGAEPPAVDHATVADGREAETPPRSVCAELEDEMGQQPLPVEEMVTLAFFVSPDPCGEQAAAVVFDDQAVFEPNVEMVELMVTLSTRHFTVLTPEPQRLFVPRTGKSRNKARFVIKAREKGVLSLMAYLYKDRNFIQGMEIQVQAGEGTGQAIVSTIPVGRPIEGAAALQGRDLSLIIKPENNQFVATMTASGSSDGILGVTVSQLDTLLQEARSALLDVVYMGKNDGDIRVYPKPKDRELRLPKGVDLVYQTGLDIPEDVNKVALRRLAEVGHSMFLDIFFGAAADADSRVMGETLLKLGSEQRLNIQVVSQQFLMPWNILYLAEEFDPQRDEVDPTRFLGLAHIVEHIPYQSNQHAVDNVIPSQPQLQVGIHVNPDIDRNGKFSIVSEQKRYWTDLNGRGGTVVAVRETLEAIASALTDSSNQDQIIYFYCHAKSEQLDSIQGPSSSFLGLGGGRNLTLKELRQRASERKVMSGAPLVVINACESAELSPLFYGGFMPYFTARGARGVIGTEAEIPASFAAKWAERFFEEFLTGTKTLGQVMFELRWEFYKEHRNVLGMLYAMYCDGDTRVSPGLGLTRGPLQ
jgi:pimeloyl-ACP methyl ester carboxylesterase